MSNAVPSKSLAGLAPGMVRVIDPGDPADGELIEPTADHTGAQRVVLGSAITVDATVTPDVALDTSAASIAAGQTSGAQKTQIVGATGNGLGEVAHPLKVDGTVDASGHGLATSALQGAGLPGALGAGGGVKIDGSGTALPVVETSAAGSRTDLDTLAAAVSAGKFQVAQVGALPAGTNVLGHVIVDSAGSVAITSLPSLPAGTNVLGHVVVDSGSALAVSSLPALPSGANTIGAVTAPGGGALATQTTLAAILALLPAALAVSGSLKVLQDAWTEANFASVPVNGVSIKVGAGAYFGAVAVNGSGISAWFQIHDLASGPPSNGAQPLVPPTSAATSNGTRTAQTVNVAGAPGGGISFSNGCLGIWSATQDTYSSAGIGVSASPVYVQVR